MRNYKPILQNDIYPKLANFIGAAFPEFEFKDNGKQWISTNTLHLSGIEGVHGKGKVTISKSKTYAISDFREGTKEVLNYLIDSTYHPQVTDFKKAVEYLASITNVELNNTSVTTGWKAKKFLPKSIPKAKPIYIPTDLFKASLSNYDKNSFVLYLNRLLGTEKTEELIGRFNIGTSKYWNRSPTVFWLIDLSKGIAGGQVILFDENGSTYKETKKDGSEKRFNSWVHSAIKNTYQKDNKPLPEWLENYIAMLASCKPRPSKQKKGVPKHALIFWDNLLSHSIYITSLRCTKKTLIFIISKPNTIKPHWDMVGTGSTAVINIKRLNTVMEALLSAVT